MVSRESEEEITNYESRPKLMKCIYITVGLVFLGIGLLGAALPVLFYYYNTIFEKLYPIKCFKLSLC